MSNIKSNRKLAAIMFADIVSYSRLMGVNEKEALKLVKDFDSISISIVEKYDGKIIKKNGDQIFCEFSSAKNAVDASIIIQERLHKYNDSRPIDFKLEVRIGIHIGDVVKENNDIFGDGVNVAARIQPLSEPGGISISGTVSEALSSHPEYKLVPKGEQELKNIVNKHSIFNVKTGYETGDIAPVKANTINLYKSLLYIFPIIIISIIILFYKRSNGVLVQTTNKNIFISKILSMDFKDIDFDLVGFTKSMGEDEIVKILSIPNVQLQNINDDEKHSIYDEILSNMMYNKKEYTIKTHYDYEESSKYAGNSINDYNEYDIYMFGMALMGMSKKSLNQTFNNHFKGSIFEIIDLSTSNIHETFAPIIYKIYNGSTFTGNYVANLVKIEFDAQDGDGVSISLDGKSFISERRGISREISFIINDWIESVVTSIDKSYIKISGVYKDEYLLKFSPDNKDKIKKRMILNVVRYLYFLENSNRDSIKSIRFNDLMDYKARVDTDTNSTFYQEFYRESNPTMSQYELDNIKSKSWFPHSEGHLAYDMLTKLKIVEIYDSTASAIIYSKDNPYVKIKVGDYLEF